MYRNADFSYFSCALSYHHCILIYVVACGTCSNFYSLNLIFTMIFRRTRRVPVGNFGLDQILMRFGDMTYMKTFLMILFLVWPLSCSVTRDAAKSSDQTNLQGAWLAETETQNGIKKNVSFLYVFKGDKITFTDETRKEMSYLFRLDTTGKPKYLVIRPVESPDSAPVSVGYELDGNSLKIVVAPEGLRPTDISDKNNQELIVCKRKGS